jgi:hypothetical protein
LTTRASPFTACDEAACPRNDTKLLELLPDTTRFPAAEEITAIPRALWEVPGGGGLQYLYVPGLSAGHLPDLLVYEPELGSGQRFLLRSNGDILQMESAKIQNVPIYCVIGLGKGSDPFPDSLSD